MSTTSNNHKSFSRKLAMLAGLAVLTVAGAADAVPLGPGDTGVPTGTNPFFDPTLNGTSVAGQSLWFTCGSVTGLLHNWIFRNPSNNELDFYYTFFNSAASTGHIAGGTISSYTPSGIVDFDFRTDLGGISPPMSATRSAAGDTIQFTFVPSAISPGNAAMAILVRSGRTTYDNAGSATVTIVGGPTCVINNVYQPL